MNLAAPTVVDLQGFGELRRRAASGEGAALAEAAVQFEALVIGMMLESARSASLGSGILDGEQTEQYLELMDQQVALELARAGGFGFGRMIMEQLGGAGASSGDGPAATPPRSPAPAAFLPPAGAPFQPRRAALRPPAAAAPFEAGPSSAAVRSGRWNVASGAQIIATPEQFVARFLPEAAEAARRLNVDPRLLVAQAALETGWGRAMPTHPNGAPANNLFGIKADPSWRGARVARWTIEHVDGVAERRREQFRAYPSSADSFADYVALIAGSPRYAAALEAGDPEAYVRAVADAGYATDPRYADKWLAVYRSDALRAAPADLKPGTSGPTQ